MAMTGGMERGHAKHARLQGAAADALVPVFAAAVDTALGTMLATPNTLNVTEIGPADGAASGKFVDAMLSRVVGTAVKSVVLTLLDVPGNDWNALALASQAWVRDANARGVHLLIRLAPGSMYDDYALPHSQDIVFAATTFH